MRSIGPTDAQLAAADERFRARRRERLRRKIHQIDHYQGLLSFCEGTITSDALGNVTVLSGKGSLPFATGHIAKLMFLQIPENGTSSGFSSREINSVSLLSMSNKESVSSKISTLSLLSSRPASAKGLLAFDRDVEASGGTEMGKQITISGKGFWEYAPQIKMPYAGSVDYEIKGLSYFGNSNDVKARIGFHFLNGVRAKLFDNGFSPADDAFEANQIPRLTPEQSKYLKKRIDMKAKGGRFAMMPSLFAELIDLKNYAPPPLTSALAKSIDKYLESESRDSDRRGIVSVKERWSTMRDFATQVPRTWSDESKSFQVSATLVAMSNRTVTLKRVDNGKTVSLSLDKLSKKDAEFASTFGRPK